MLAYEVTQSAYLPQTSFRDCFVGNVKNDYHN